MAERIPTSVLSIVKAEQNKGEKLTTLTCRMTGEFKPFTDAVIFPGERKFQVRDITPTGDNNYQVKVKGISFKECVPFAVITPVNLKVRYGKKAYFIPTDYHSKEFYAGDYYITGGIFNGYRMFNREKYTAKVFKVGNLYTASFPFRAPLVPGGEYLFENTKGFKGSMTLLYPGEMGKKSENIINSRIEKFRSRPGLKGIYSIILRTDNYVELPYFLENESFEGALEFGNRRIMEREYNSVVKKIEKQSKASGGGLLNDIKKSCDVKPPFFHAVLDQLIADGTVFTEGDYIVNNSKNRADFLSPLAKESYKRIDDASDSGLSSRSSKDFGIQRCFEEIRRMRLVTVLDEDLFFNSEGFKRLLDRIFNGKSIGENLSIQEVRDSSGLSRRYIISLFNQLEDRGIIDRVEEDERVIKTIP